MNNLLCCPGQILGGFLGGLMLVSTALAHSSSPAASPEVIHDPALRACVLRTLSDAYGSGNSLGQITELKCHNQGIKSIAGLEHLTNLRTLSLFRNRIRRVDITLPASLESLNLARNQLERLTLTRLPRLREVFVFGNRLTKLELHQLPQLVSLRANDNRLIRFEYQALDRIEKLYLFNNSLETLDIHHLPAMRYMDCRQNPMPDPLYDEMDRMEQVTFLHDGNAEDW